MLSVLAGLAGLSPDDLEADTEYLGRFFKLDEENLLQIFERDCT
jgi:hypothetical protein